MAYTPVTLNDHEGQSPVAGLFRCNSSGIYAAFHKILTDSLFGMVQLVAHYHNRMDGLLCKLTEPCVRRNYQPKNRSKSQTAIRIISQETQNYFITVTSPPYKPGALNNRQNVSSHQLWTNLHSYITSSRSNAMMLLLGWARRLNFLCRLLEQASSNLFKLRTTMIPVE